jgi:hypothetical protein
MYFYEHWDRSVIKIIKLIETTQLERRVKEGRNVGEYS